MKAIAIAAAAAGVLLGTAAHAQQQATTSPVYGELGYSWMQVEGNGFKANPGAVRGIVGYDVHPNIAIEGMLAGSVKHDTDNGVDAKLNSSYGLFVKPKYAIGNTELFGRVGWARTNVELNGVDTKSNDLAYGIGAKYNFTPRMNVGLDYTRYSDKNGVKVGGVTVGLGYRF